MVKKAVRHLERYNFITSNVCCIGVKFLTGTESKSADIDSVCASPTGVQSVS